MTWSAILEFLNVMGCQESHVSTYDGILYDLNTTAMISRIVEGPHLHPLGSSVL